MHWFPAREAAAQLRHGRLEKKICRVTTSPGIPTCPVLRASALVHHPGITAVEHLLQVTRPRPLDGESFLLFDNTVICWPLDSPQHPQTQALVAAIPRLRSA